MRSESAVEVNAPATLVFALITPARLGAWFGVQDGAKWAQVGSELWGKGARMQVSSADNKSLNFTAEVTEFSAPALITWKTLQGPASTISFILFPVEMTVSIQLIEEFDAGLFGKLGAGKARTVRNAAFMDNLKKLAEWEAYQGRKAGRADAPSGPVSPIQLMDNL